jgi:general secretion pathway protein H
MPAAFAKNKATGFTLLELMVVLVVVGIMLGLVTVNSFPNKQQALQRDAQRIALLLQLAREEAIVRNKQVAFELDNDGYRFYVRHNDKWELLADNDLFRERKFDKAPLIISIQPNPKEMALPLKIIFGREPVDKPFTLTLTFENVSASIHADGVGHFSVE